MANLTCKQFSVIFNDTANLKVKRRDNLDCIDDSVYLYTIENEFSYFDQKIRMLYLLPFKAFDQILLYFEQKYVDCKLWLKFDYDSSEVVFEDITIVSTDNGEPLEQSSIKELIALLPEHATKLDKDFISDNLRYAYKKFILSNYELQERMQTDSFLLSISIGEFRKTENPKQQN